jgi:hypothetical protein
MRKYRLKKDYCTPLFRYKAGTQLATIGDIYCVGKERYTESEIQQCADWFEETSEQEKEAQFVWTDELVREAFGQIAHELMQGNIRSVSGQIKLFKQSKQPLPDKEEKMPLKLSKDASDFIQMTFNVSDDFYWTDFFFKKVDENIFELWKHSDLPKHVKSFTNEYTQQQMDEAIEAAFYSARNGILVSNFGNVQFKDHKEYLNSIKQHP